MLRGVSFSKALFLVVVVFFYQFKPLIELEIRTNEEQFEAETPRN